MRTVPALLLLATGCLPEASVIERIDLADLLEVDDPDVTGLSTEPETGALVLVESDGTLWRYGDAPERLLEPGALADAGYPGEASDVAAMPDGRYAITIPNLGLKFDPSDGSIVDWFCYLPGSFGDWEVQTQETNSLAWDARTGHLVSQPITLEDGEPIRSDVAQFDGMDGGDLAWFPLKNDRFYASGVATWSDGIQLVAGGVVYEHDYGSNDPTPQARIPTEAAEGLTWWRDRLTYVDPLTQELVVIAY